MIRRVLRQQHAWRASLPARLRSQRVRLAFHGVVAICAWLAASIAVLVALYAPFPTPTQRLAWLVGAPVALIVPLWRAARVLVPEGDGRLLRWRRLDCIAVGYLLGGAAVACAVVGVTLLAVRGDASATEAVLFFGLGGAAILGLQRYFVMRQRLRSV